MAAAYPHNEHARCLTLAGYTIAPELAAVLVLAPPGVGSLFLRPPPSPLVGVPPAANV